MHPRRLGIPGVASTLIVDAVATNITKLLEILLNEKWRSVDVMKYYHNTQHFLQKPKNVLSECYEDLEMKKILQWLNDLFTSKMKVCKCYAAIIRRIKLKLQQWNKTIRRER